MPPDPTWTWSFAAVAQPDAASTRKGGARDRDARPDTPVDDARMRVIGEGSAPRCIRFTSVIGAVTLCGSNRRGSLSASQQDRVIQTNRRLRRN
ncbi:uncharacterized protein N7482_007800 [Penicillium canariense]|uniref:Uncharacterized protein n=1 Tax=Penicillium canariense TaxID=189055 RepID=A0A9W9HZR0_9EURO|nr:uncharacterized protein N7482_007800 [Penicillium canariense]KAJ5160796.1 hypothetical protein N7482_007800 [Penicillium canariense]